MIGKRGSNRKGQEGVTLTTLLLIILGVVVVVVIIIGFTSGFGFITNLFNVAPGKSLEAAVQSCTISAQSDLKTDYCVDLKQVDINGENKYVTCSYLEQGKYLGEIKLDCGADLKLTDLRAAEFCVNKKLKDSQFVEDKTCKDLINDNISCASLKGEWMLKSACESPSVDKTSSVGDKDKIGKEGSVCCVSA